MTRRRTRYSETGADEKGDMGQKTLGEEDLSSPERKSNVFKKRLAETFDEHCYFALYTVKDDLLDNMSEDM